MQQASFRLKRKFRNTIRKLYRQKGWNPQLGIHPRQKAFLAYISFLRIYAYDQKLKEYEKFQVEDMMLALVKVECLLIRTRRGGKSRDGSVIAVFWVLVSVRVVWLSASSDQLDQARIWFGLNPFVVQASEYKIQIMFTRYVLPFTIVTKSRSASKGTDVLIFDEGRAIDLNLEQYTYYKMARGMAAESTDLHILHVTTTSLNSVEFEVYNQLLEDDPEAITIHTWHDCHWINKDFIESEKRKNAHDPWYVMQEYECRHVARGGQLLKNIVETTQIPFKADKWGVDPNEYFMFVGVYIDRDYNNCWVTKELELDWYNDADRAQAIKIMENAACEVEDGGFNFHAARAINREVSVTKSLWDKEIKGERLGIAKTFDNIYIDPKVTPKTYSDLIGAIYNPLYPIWQKDTKHPLHWGEAFFHAIGAKPFKVYASDSKAGIYQGDRIRHIMKYGNMRR